MKNIKTKNQKVNYLIVKSEVKSKSKVKVMSLKNRLRDTDKDTITIQVLDGGGFKMECKNKDGTEWGSTYYGLVSYESLQNLEGKVLTILDAALIDKDQRKAVKDIFRRTFWFDWIENQVYKGKDNLPAGMPIANSINSI